MQSNILVKTLGVSTLLHTMVLVLVMTVDLPPPTSQAEYADWVKKISNPPREAVLAPIPEETYKPLPSNTKKIPDQEGAGGDGKGGSPAGASAKAGGVGGNKAAVRAAVSAQGVLGVIGVASGGGGEFEDVFSSSSDGVRGDLEGAMAGKKAVVLPSAGSGLGRKRMGGEGEGGSGGNGAADIGGVAVASGGSAAANKRRESEIPVPQVSTGEGNVVSGNIDRQAVSSIVARKRPGFQRCYERGLKMDPNMKGRVEFELTIGDDGSVVDVRFVQDQLKSREVLDCVKGILTRLTLPKPQSGLATVKYGLMFEPRQ